MPRRIFICSCSVVHSLEEHSQKWRNGGRIQVLCYLLSSSRLNPISRRLDELWVYLDADVFPPENLGGHQGTSPSAEGVKHPLAFFGEGFDDGLKARHRLLCRMERVAGVEPSLDIGQYEVRLSARPVLS